MGDEGLSSGWEQELSYFLTHGPGRARLLDLLPAQPADRTPRVAGGTGRVSAHRSLCFNACTLTDFCGKVVTAILLDPEATLARCDQIVAQSLLSLVDVDTPRPPIHWRLSALPPFRDFVRDTVPKSEDVGLLLSIRGTAIKTGWPKMLEKRKRFHCGSCGYSFELEADFEQFYKFDKPATCPNPDRVCRNTYQFTAALDMEPEFCRDYQEIKIQEQVSNLNMGTIPRSIWVTLEDDLVDVCKPGDDVTVIGVVKRRWYEMGRAHDGRTEIGLCLKANFIEVNNDQKSRHLVNPDQVLEFEDFWQAHAHSPLVGRNKLLASFCPQVYGLYAVKLALAIVLCGGVERVDESGTRVRGEAHMLMVGDPGTGKSQLLRYAAKISPRSVLTTGIGSTSAGLTVSAVKDSGEWHLEAGALVLADGGVCCIDEFNSIREADRTSIHEAMEQQSLSVAKAGLVCKLQSRCSVLAATNPKGHYDSEEPLTVNIGIASPLLSRFDLVFTLLDARNEIWDKIVSGYLLQGKNPLSDLTENVTKELWPFDKLQSYFVYCKRNNPDLSDDAIEVLSRYYQRQRNGEDQNNMARTTVRMLQSAIRLAQGHARLMRKSRVEIMDAVYAVILLEISSEASSSLLQGVNPLHTTFPEDPLNEYKAQAEVILEGLNLPHLLKSEMTRLQVEKEVANLDRTRSTVKTVSSTSEPQPLKPSNQMSEVISKLRTNQFDYGKLSDCVISKQKKSSLNNKRKENVKKRKSSGCSKGNSKRKKASPFEKHDISSGSSTDEFEPEGAPVKSPKKIQDNSPQTSTQLPLLFGTSKVDDFHIDESVISRTCESAKTCESPNMLSFLPSPVTKRSSDQFLASSTEVNRIPVLMKSEQSSPEISMKEATTVILDERETSLKPRAQMTTQIFSADGEDIDELDDIDFGSQSDRNLSSFIASQIELHTSTGHPLAESGTKEVNVEGNDCSESKKVVKNVPINPRSIFYDPNDDDVSDLDFNLT
ncbi:hypothetical protein TCAL_02324 [Tigriopus californicus]|uniref:DNA helicase n=1 Tax=Tigriopus californicus TaxID=6832 RepID=A0A553NYU4_TIGCA|nr:DNA helicase MCM9-like [Tigriopus californicus]TRY70613.1 hypothetical protein TCAL_02324 [Tigriopus californicus]